jgi:hypothetical protein
MHTRHTIAHVLLSVGVILSGTGAGLSYRARAARADDASATSLLSEQAAQPKLSATVVKERRSHRLTQLKRQLRPCA